MLEVGVRGSARLRAIGGCYHAFGAHGVQRGVLGAKIVERRNAALVLRHLRAERGDLGSTGRRERRGIGVELRSPIFACLERHRDVFESACAVALSLRHLCVALGKRLVGIREPSCGQVEEAVRLFEPGAADVALRLQGTRHRCARRSLRRGCTDRVPTRLDGRYRGLDNGQAHTVRLLSVDTERCGLVLPLRFQRGAGFRGLLRSLRGLLRGFVSCRGVGAARRRALMKPLPPVAELVDALPGVRDQIPEWACLAGVGMVVRAAKRARLIVAKLGATVGEIEPCPRELERAVGLAPGRVRERCLVIALLGLARGSCRLVPRGRRQTELERHSRPLLLHLRDDRRERVGSPQPLDELLALSLQRLGDHGTLRFFICRPPRLLCSGQRRLRRTDPVLRTRVRLDGLGLGDEARMTLSRRVLSFGSRHRIAIQRRLAERPSLDQRGTRRVFRDPGSERDDVAFGLIDLPVHAREVLLCSSQVARGLLLGRDQHVAPRSAVFDQQIEPGCVAKRILRPLTLRERLRSGGHLDFEGGRRLLMAADRHARFDCTRIEQRGGTGLRDLGPLHGDERGAQLGRCLDLHELLTLGLGPPQR